MLEPLDPYLQTDDGQKLFHQFDEKAWERVSINGTNYGLYNYPILTYSISLFINQKMTDAYDIQLPDELEHLAQVEDVLKLVSDKDQDEVVPLYISLIDYKELSGYDFLENGLAAGYDDDGNPYVFNPFEQSNITSLMETLAHYSQQGYLLKDEEAEEMVYNGDFFAIVDTTTPRSYSDVVLDISGNFFEAVGYKLVDTFVILNPNGIHGIASWSEHKDEAFQLLMLLNTDSELSNLLYHGIEGKHYTLVDGEMVPGDDRQRTPKYYSPANEMLTHPIGLEPSNKEEVYKEWNENFQMSPIAGFDLDDSEISIDLETIKNIYEKYENLWSGDEQDVATQLAKANEELQEAGIDQALDEINQQLKNWWESKD